MIGVQRAFTDVSYVFEANGLSKTERPFQDAKIHDQGRILEVIGNKIVPFELQTTGDAVWRHFTRSIKEMPFRAYSPKVCAQESRWLPVCWLPLSCWWS